MLWLLTGRWLRHAGAPKSSLSVPFVRHNSHEKTTFKNTTKHNTFGRWCTQRLLEKIRNTIYFFHSHILLSSRRRGGGEAVLVCGPYCIPSKRFNFKSGSLSCTLKPGRMDFSRFSNSSKLLVLRWRNLHLTSGYRCVKRMYDSKYNGICNAPSIFYFFRQKVHGPAGIMRRLSLRNGLDPLPTIWSCHIATVTALLHRSRYVTALHVTAILVLLVPFLLSPQLFVNSMLT